MTNDAAPQHSPQAEQEARMREAFEQEYRHQLTDDVLWTGNAGDLWRRAWKSALSTVAPPDTAALTEQLRAMTAERDLWMTYTRTAEERYLSADVRNRDLEAQLAPREPVIGEWPECEEFYNLMQDYRHYPLTPIRSVLDAYEAVKTWLRASFPKAASGALENFCEPRPAIDPKSADQFPRAGVGEPDFKAIRVIEAAKWANWCPDAGGYKGGRSVEDCYEELHAALQAYFNTDLDSPMTDWISEDQLTAVLDAAAPKEPT